MIARVTDTGGTEKGLTHVRADGTAHMVDVSGKEVTARRATASGMVLLSPAAVAALRGGAVPKGDALGVARVAGIQAVKRTPDLIPLAHPVAVHAVEVDLEVLDAGVSIRAAVRTADRTGIEMEALTAVSVAALALVDMVKAVDKHARITDVRVTAKSGGRSGDWEEPDVPDAVAPTSRAARHAPPVETPSLAGARAVVVTCSTRAAAGVYPDRGGALLVETLRGWGADVPDALVVPDGPRVARALASALATGPDLLVTTGGTGLTPTDGTPEATRPLLDCEVPGLAEAIRARGVAKGVPTAVLSRGLAGVAGHTLVINLPGSTGGVRDALAVLAEVLPHALSQARGGDH
ncbi:MAG TPA: bifunctional molybdenum cofactor biosynthesis protein MoaC/MoaB [Actinotalea sp.]|nr:bifunctional molybdenum cofactor biosynthesis protein MoaC/MoaB [Actinotalea sp.]